MRKVTVRKIIVRAKSRTYHKNYNILRVTSRVASLPRRIFWIVSLFLTLPAPAHADVKIGEKFGFGDVTSLGQATSQLVMPIFSLAAVAVIIYFLFGAFKYLVSRGNKEEVAAAKGIITHSIIGFVILMFAFLLLQFLLSSLFGISGFLIQN